MSDEVVQTVPAKNPRRWLQIGIAPSSDPSPDLYRRISELTHDLVDAGLVENHFFMHKPPGLRLRFQARPRKRVDVVTSVHQAVAQWTGDGVVSKWGHGFYEPEEALFGGPVSMSFVHRLFTADSTAWLRQHSARRAPGWVMALTMTRSLLDTFGIGQWEDSDVGHLLRRAGRTMRDPGPGTADVLARLSRWWRDPAELLASLSPEDRCSLAVFRTQARTVIPEWVAEYFETPHATVGPRQALAYCTIFMWNRARLSPFRQALLADSLALIP